MCIKIWICEYIVYKMQYNISIYVYIHTNMKICKYIEKQRKEHIKTESIKICQMYKNVYRNMLHFCCFNSYLRTYG